MKFRTEIEVQKVRSTIDHRHPIVTMGSCFAENIAHLLKTRFFDVLENPFGVLYNPLSIARALRFILENKTFEQKDLIFHQDEWHSLWHHSTFSHHDARQCLSRINQALQEAHQFLKKARWLIITFGTAFVYVHQKRKTVVANCHKLPETEFERRLVSVTDIVRDWSQLLHDLRQFNAQLNVIFSVSPIRHLRDGLVQNQKSKATLILATHQLLETGDNHFYFPAYEILLDDLRDYRFYEANLTHPNQQAVTYIWEKFQDMFFEAETLQVVREIERFNKRREHRLRNPQSPGAQQFKADTEQQRQQLLQKYPYLKERHF